MSKWNSFVKRKISPLGSGNCRNEIRLLFLLCFFLLLGFVIFEFSHLLSPFRHASTNDNIPALKETTLGIFIQASSNIPKVFVLLDAIYHRKNTYCIHLDKKAPESEHLLLKSKIESGIYGKNVFIVPSQLITYRGISMVDNTITGMNCLLLNGKWNFFINLSASDYPLISMKDLLSIFQHVPPFVNFIDGSLIREQEKHRYQTFHYDPALRFQSSPLQTSPCASKSLPMFDLYKGSAWMILSRNFCTYITNGMDGLARRMLLYFSNTLSPAESYFHTLLENSPMKGTRLNTDMHFIVWKDPKTGASFDPWGQHPFPIRSDFIPHIQNSGHIFARKFADESDKVLDHINQNMISTTNQTYLNLVAQRIHSQLLHIDDKWKSQPTFYPSLNALAKFSS